MKKRKKNSKKTKKKATTTGKDRGKKEKRSVLSATVHFPGVLRGKSQVKGHVSFYWTHRDDNMRLVTRF